MTAVDGAAPYQDTENSSTAAPVRWRIDPSELSLREMGEIAQLLNAPLSDVLTGLRQHEGIAAAAWIVIRRTDPTFTYEQALDLRPMRDIEMVNEAPSSEAPAGGSGDAPPSSLAPGG